MNSGTGISPPDLDIPTAWKEIDFPALRGTILVTGAPDAGKTTFANYLYSQLRAAGMQAGYLDGDPGQSQLGPPGTITMVYDSQPQQSAASPVRLSAEGKCWRRFIGAVSPVGHMLQLVVSAARLVQHVQQAGARVVIYDTCGLVQPSGGGAALKLALIDLLQPSLVFAIQRRDELEPLLSVLRLGQRARVSVLQPSQAAHRRSTPLRRANRAGQFARYFDRARTLQIDYTQLAVVPALRFSLHRMAALEDSHGFVRHLGIITKIDWEARQLSLLTPAKSLSGATTLHLGSLAVDPDTYEHTSLPADGR